MIRYVHIVSLRDLSSPRLVHSVSCLWLVRELSSPRVDQSASWQSASWRIHELSSNRLCPRGVWTPWLSMSLGRWLFTELYRLPVLHKKMQFILSSIYCCVNYYTIVYQLLWALTSNDMLYNINFAKNKYVAIHSCFKVYSHLVWCGTLRRFHCCLLQYGIPYIPRLLDNSWIRQLADCQLADWTTRGLVNSRTRQLAYWTTRGCHRRLHMLSFPFWRHLPDCELSSPRLVQSASWPVHEMSSPRVGVSASCPVTYSSSCIHWHLIYNNV